MRLLGFALVAALCSISAVATGQHLLPIAANGEQGRQNQHLGCRQGGDTIETATLVTGIPYDDTGTTIGYTNDYDQSCPYLSSEPDVVYRYTPEYSLDLTVDLWGSDYDTKVWIWDAEMDLIACNDDYYSNWVSKIVAAPLLGGAIYYVVIDGHPGHSGDYVIHLEEYQPCEIPCPGGAALEDEPTLHDGYVDELNGGCASLDQLGYAPYQSITEPIFCAVSGWYDAPGPIDWDIDCFTLVIPDGGVLDVTVESEMSLLASEADPQDCDDIWIGTQIHVAGCSENSMAITGAAGDTVWVIVRPAELEIPSYFDGNEFDYVVRSNVAPSVRTESRSWSQVKAMFR